METKIRPTHLNIFFLIVLLSGLTVGLSLIEGSQHDIDSIILKDNLLDSSWITDSKGNRIIDVDGEICILYHNVTTIQKEYEQIYKGAYRGYVDGNWTGKYINKTITKEIKHDCWELENLPSYTIDTILEEKINFSIMIEREKIRSFQTKQDYNTKDIKI